MIIKESIENVLKPKSKKEIEDLVCNLSNAKIVKIALQQDSREIIYMALERNLSPELNGEILKWAVKDGDYELIEYLLNNKDIDPKKLIHAIKASVKEFNNNILDILVNYPKFDPSYNKNQLIRWAATTGEMEFIKFLLNDPRVDPSDLRNAALRGAEIYEHTYIIELLLNDERVRKKLNKIEMKKYGIKESLSDILVPKSKEEIKKAALKIEDPNELLRLSISKINNPELVKIAIERGADPNKISGDVSKITNTEIIKILLSNPQMSISVNSLIYKAIKMNLVDEVIKLISDDKLNPGQKNSQILVWAVGFGRDKLVKKLLKDPRIKPENENESIAEALSIAIARKNNKIIKCLLNDKRIDPSGDFNRPIKVASQFGNIEAVKMLLNDPRVDPSASDLSNNEENFSIKSAVKGDYLDIVKLLLKAPKVRKKLSNEEIKEYEEMAKFANKIVKENI